MNFLPICNQFNALWKFETDYPVAHYVLQVPEKSSPRIAYVWLYDGLQEKETRRIYFKIQELYRDVFAETWGSCKLMM